MKSVFSKITFLLILSIGFLSCAQNSKSSNVSETIEINNVKEVIAVISPEEFNENMGDIQLVDVRTPKEFSEGHLKNAVNIDFFDASFMEDMGKLDKNKELYIYCRSGNRSGKASKKLKAAGFTKVYDLEGGIIKWNKNNFEVIK